MNRWGTALALGTFATIVATGECFAAEGEATAVSPGMRVYIDPETGDFGAAPEPVSEEIAPSQRAHSLDDLVKEPNPAGGFSIDLKRRFGGVARAVATKDGIAIECEAGDVANEK